MTKYSVWWWILDLLNLVNLNFTVITTVCHLKKNPLVIIWASHRPIVNLNHWVNNLKHLSFSSCNYPYYEPIRLWSFTYIIALKIELRHWTLFNLTCKFLLNLFEISTPERFREWFKFEIFQSELMWICFYLPYDLSLEFLFF